MKHNYEILFEVKFGKWIMIMNSCLGCGIIMGELRLRHPSEDHMNAAECTHPETALHNIKRNEKGTVMGYACEDCGSKFEYNYDNVPKIDLTLESDGVDEIPTTVEIKNNVVLSEEIDSFLDTIGGV